MHLSRIFHCIYFFILSIHFIQVYSLSSKFDNIVVFGDGNSDTVNAYNLTNHQWPLSPPYYRGRASNGPIWIDDLRISNVLNYAYVGATIDNDNLIEGFTGPNKTIVPGIRRQIVDYLSTHDVSQADLSRTLYVIWASGTEYFLNESLTSNVIVNSLLAAIHDLLVIDINYLIVINLPPLEFYPDKHNDSRLSSLVKQHNSDLTSNLLQIQSDYEEISVDLFDMYSFITNLMFNQTLHLNFSEKNDSCLKITNFTLISQCQNANEYIFIDNFHYTSVVHQLFANQISTFVFSSSVVFHVSKSLFFLSLFVFLWKKINY